MYGRYTWWGKEAYAVTLLRSTKNLFNQTIRENCSIITSPPSATSTSRALTILPKVTNKQSSTQQRNSFDLIQEEEMDRAIDPTQWSCSSCTLLNPNSRSACDACGTIRNF